MQETVFIDQRRLTEWGITYNHGAIFYFIHGLDRWAKAEVFDGQTYYYCSYQKIVTELPGLNLSPRRVRKLCAELISAGVISREVTRNNKVHFRVTDKGKKWSYRVPKKPQKFAKIGTQYKSQNFEFLCVEIGLNNAPSDAQKRAEKSAIKTKKREQKAKRIGVNRAVFRQNRVARSGHPIETCRQMSLTSPKEGGHIWPGGVARSGHISVIPVISNIFLSKRASAREKTNEFTQEPMSPTWEPEFSPDRKWSLQQLGYTPEMIASEVAGYRDFFLGKPDTQRTPKSWNDAFFTKLSRRHQKSPPKRQPRNQGTSLQDLHAFHGDPLPSEQPGNDQLPAFMRKSNDD